jgi:hypothetical protein
MKLDLLDRCKRVQFSFEFIAPDTALEMLEKNTSNYRNRSDSTTSRYESDMAKGLFTITTATIAFAEDGRLIDGQTRLTACVQSGVGFWTFVLRNCPKELIDDPNQDKGKMRNLSLYLKKHGYSNTTAMAGSIRALRRYCGFKSLRCDGASSITDAACLSICQQMPDLFFKCVARVANSTALKKVYPPSVTIAFYYIASHRSVEDADTFMKVLAKEQDELSNHPANVFREQVMADRKMEPNRYMNLMFSAFNSMVLGESRKLIRESDSALQHPEYVEAMRKFGELSATASK